MITKKEKLFFFLVLILVVIFIGYIKSLMYGGNEETALAISIIFIFIVVSGATILTKKYIHKWDKRLK